MIPLGKDIAHQAIFGRGGNLCEAFLAAVLALGGGRRRPVGEAHVKTLAVMSRKGGAGKTTVAVNLMLAARALYRALARASADVAA